MNNIFAEVCADGDRAQQLRHRTEARNDGAVKEPATNRKVLAAVA
jgi:hypothetical protein